MILSAHQSAYNPWLGLIHKILLSDTFVVMDDVQFEKNSFTNRNKILQRDQEIMLTIPLQMRGHTTKTIKDMKIASHIWKSKHLKSIEQSYKKTPYFDKVFPSLEQIYTIQSEYLKEYTDAYLNFLIQYLHVKTKIIHASTLDIKAKKLDYVIELCQKLNGDTFIFGALGAEYADKKKLAKYNITPIFQNYKHPVYHQKSDTFHPYLGIIDLLFNEANPEAIILQDNITKSDLKT